MATDLESLVLSISADTTQVKRALDRMEKDAKGAAQGVERSFSNVVPFQKMEQGFKRSSAAMANDARNLSFQFNDLFTQISSGTSVAQAFNQQIGQIGQTLGAAGGIRAGASLVGQALLGMVPTLALTAAFSAITAAATTFFGEAEEGAKDVNAELDKQLELINKVRAAQGKGALGSTAETELDRFVTLREAMQQQATNLAALTTKAKEYESTILGMSKDAFEGQTATIQAVDSAITRLMQGIEQGNPDFFAFAKEMAELEKRGNLPANIAQMVTEIINLASQSAIAARNVSTLKSELDGLKRTVEDAGKLDLSNPITGPSRGPGGALDMRAADASIAGQNKIIARERGKADAKAYMDGLEPELRSRLEALFADAPGGMSVSSGRRSTQRQAQLWAAKLRETGGNVAEARRWVAPPGHSMHEKGMAADLAYESEAVKRWAHENAAAYGLVFRLKNEDWHIEVARAEATKATSSAQRDQTGASSGLAAGTVQLTEAQKAQVAAQDESRRAAEQLAEQWNSTLKNALGGFVSDLRQGVEAGDAFRNMLNRVIDSLVNTALEAMFAQDALGGVIKQFLGLGGGGSSIIPGLPFPPAPTMHTGGKVGGASRSMRSGVNPAIFAGAPRFHNGLLPGEFPAILQKGEIVLPKNMAKAAGASAGGGVVNNISVDVSTGAVVANNQDAKALGIVINKAIQTALVVEKRPGGLLRA